MESKLDCECCGTKMRSDLTGSVWCDNSQCLLKDKCYSHDFIYGRLVARQEGKPMQEKEYMAQGWAGNPGDWETAPEEVEPTYPELMVGVMVQFEDANGATITGEIEGVLSKDVKVCGLTPAKSHVKLHPVLGHRIDDRNWVVVQRTDFDSYRMLKCSEKILHEDSPFCEQGFAVVYYDECYEDIAEYCRDEIKSTKERLACQQ